MHQEILEEAIEIMKKAIDDPNASDYEKLAAELIHTHYDPEIPLKNEPSIKHGVLALMVGSSPIIIAKGQTQEEPDPKLYRNLLIALVIKGIYKTIEEAEIANENYSASAN